MKKRYIFIGSVALLGIAIAAFYYTRTQRSKDSTPGKTTQQSWNTITPGKTSVDDVIKSIGTHLSIVEKDGDQTVTYQSTNKYWTNEVHAKNKTVSFVRERIFPPSDDSLKRRTQEYTAQATILYGPESSSGRNLYTYIEQGTAFLANKDLDTVYEIWYFTPMSTIELLKLPQLEGYATTETMHQD